MENAKLMIRLTEVMKCWHEIAGENRTLKSQLSDLKQSRDNGSLQSNSIISALVNGGSHSQVMISTIAPFLLFFVSGRFSDLEALSNFCLL